MRSHYRHSPLVLPALGLEPGLLIRLQQLQKALGLNRIDSVFDPALTQHRWLIDPHSTGETEAQRRPAIELKC